mmetsp:Transcript_48057/g.134227  ORF Transcript_48057/g.134227 Transcript_48057/m.134227 type:complete len:321 (-) Transcript_48057:96-1058(-)|eukprot:CAMPEP_0119524690 /NCGR_PEP_ID=MMETSP1344-20130328/39598_1 /TAXON_ID=236787 /ORGANISM="Florenciella parvula, Strain CCMP2471" /LENGTH=320 /DNA_ID=CAMNT_0007563265 /DNA_START=67 /DNA_END=1029 /DNA_ORIENTATION=+
MQSVVRPLLKQSATASEVIVTERAGHARDFMRAAGNLAEYWGVVAVGGDGMLAEVVQGVAARTDSEEVLAALPLGHIPAGSGNGLAKSILSEAGELYDPLAATFLVLKATPKPLDLSVVTTPESRDLSFLCLGWAIISDVDIESERYRWLGSARFTVGAIERIAFLRHYRGRLAYLPADEGTVPPRPDAMPAWGDAAPAEWVTIEDSFVMLWVLQTSHAAHDMHSSPNSSLADGVFTIMLLRSGATTRLGLLSLFLQIEDGTHVNNAAVESVRARAFRLEPLTDQGIYSLDGEVVPYGPIQGTMLPGVARVLGDFGGDGP